MYVDLILDLGDVNLVGIVRVVIRNINMVIATRYSLHEGIT